MNVDVVVDVMREALFLILKTAAPPLIVSLVIGLIVSVFQTVTSMSFSAVRKRKISELSLISRNAQTRHLKRLCARSLLQKTADANSTSEAILTHSTLLSLLMRRLSELLTHSDLPRTISFIFNY